MSWRFFAIAIDAGAAACAAVNSAYFMHRLVEREERPRARTLALAVLALISLGALLEAALLTSAALHPAEDDLTGSVGWTLVRLMALVSAAGVTLLVLQRMVSR